MLPSPIHIDVTLNSPTAYFLIGLVATVFCWAVKPEAVRASAQRRTRRSRVVPLAVVATDPVTVTATARAIGVPPTLSVVVEG